MSGEIEPAPLEGTIVEPVIPLHYWPGISANDITTGLVKEVFRDTETGNIIFDSQGRFFGNGN